MFLHEVIDYRIKIWNQTILKIRLTITERLYFSFLCVLCVLHLDYSIDNGKQSFSMESYTQYRFFTRG